MPLSGENNDVSNFSQSPLMRYWSNLQIKRTGIKARNEFKFGPIGGLFTSELFALEH